jgi:selenocysteine-specific elongation factor
MTVGGGIVIDPNPGRKHRRMRGDVIERLETLAQGSPADVLLQDLERRSPVMIGALLNDRQTKADHVGRRALEGLVREGRAVILDAGPIMHPDEGITVPTLLPKTLVVSRTWWSKKKNQVIDMLSSHHRMAPLQAGMSREALRSGLGLKPKVFNALMDGARAEGYLVDEGSLVRLPTHHVLLNGEQQESVDSLLQQFRQNPYAPPSIKECVAAVGEDVLDVLVRRGDLLQVSAEVVFLSETFAVVKSQISDYIVQYGSITLAQVRDVFKTSRKYAQAMIEYLDSQGVTKRVGDERVLK